MPEDRELRFIEARNIKDFGNAFKEIGKHGVFPIKGGMIEHGVVVTLPDGRSFFGVSYKGEIDRWRAALVASCKASGRIWAWVEEGSLALSSGESVLIETLKVEEC